MRLWYTSTVNVHSSFKTEGALPTVQLRNSWEIFTLALEAHEVLGQIPSMCLNGENDPFPNYPFKGGDQRCEIVSSHMDGSATASGPGGPAVTDDWGADCEQRWGGGVYFSD